MTLCLKETIIKAVLLLTIDRGSELLATHIVRKRNERFDISGHNHRHQLGTAVEVPPRQVTDQQLENEEEVLPQKSSKKEGEVVLKTTHLLHHTCQVFLHLIHHPIAAPSRKDKLE